MQDGLVLMITAVGRKMWPRIATGDRQARRIGLGQVAKSKRCSAWGRDRLRPARGTAKEKDGVELQAAILLVRYESAGARIPV